MVKTCAECGIEFVGRRADAKYHSAQCKKKAENRRKRPTTFQDAVAEAKGPNCTNCRRVAISVEEKRFVMFLDGAEETVDNAHYLCFPCFKRFTRQQAHERGFVRFYEGFADD